MMSNLRVIAGKAGGLELQSVPGKITRPITDLVKESLFNILDPDLAGAHFLDLFAGTGSVGIEALSRGAAYVRFVEKHRLAVKTIYANLEYTNLEEGADVFHIDAFTMLNKGVDRDFDYIYIAPPQYRGLWKKTLQILDKTGDWLTDSAWVIVQIDPVEYDVLDLKCLSEFDQRRYSNTLLVFYEKVPL